MNFDNKKELANAIHSAYCKAEEYLLKKCNDLNEDIKYPVAENNGYIKWFLYITPSDTDKVYLRPCDSCLLVTSKDICNYGGIHKGKFIDGEWTGVDKCDKHVGLNAMKGVIDKWSDIKECVEKHLEQNNINKYKNFNV